MEKKKLRVKDNGNAPEIYASKFITIVYDGACANIALGAIRMATERTDDPAKPEQPPFVQVTGTVIMTPQAMVDLHGALTNLLKTIAVPISATKPPGEAH